MKKTIVYVLSILIFVILMGRLFFFNWQNFFRHNITNPIPESVSEFKYKRDTGAMHGAIIFQFKADKIDFNSIIKVKNLVPYASYQQIPDWIKYVLENRFKNTSWWNSQKLISMQIYGLTWEDNEPHALFLFVDKQNKIQGIIL